MADLKMSIFTEIEAKNWFFFSVKKFQISKFHPVFCLQRREMVFPTLSVSFRSISCRYFSKWWLRIFSGGSHSPVPSDFDGLPYARVRGTPGLFFIKMTVKDVKRLIRCPGSLCFAVWCNRRKTVRKGGNHPLRKTRVKNVAFSLLK